MLILAGVSINAIVGDNGVLTRTQYASFLNEMSAVEEAVQLWKAGESIEANGEETKLIPANGLCKANELTSTERLVGEVGYYRVWSLSETQPITDILSSASDFNSAFESEIVTYPAGVQDLYYLNNDALGIKEDKTYLIDAATGMIYSMTGIGLKGVRCYSSNMAKSVMNGDNTAPLFAEAEVSGAGSGKGEVLAGNPDAEYGFQIIADSSNENLYKLYNNGDLYAKGIKGTLLNTPQEDMKEIDETIWQKFSIPEQIPGSNIGNVEIVPGYNTMYIIDENKELWAWGDNSYNKLGLTQEEQIEYTGKVPIKLNVDNKKIYKIFPTKNSTYVITMPEDNGKYYLYVSGYNPHGELGVNSLEASTTKFIKAKFEHPENIVAIAAPDETYCNWTILLSKDGSDSKLYFSGSTNSRTGALDKFF